jgi:hypothetical protein
MRFLIGMWQSIAMFVCLIGLRFHASHAAIAEVIIDRGIAQRDDRQVLTLSLAMIGAALLSAFFIWPGASRAPVAHGIAFDLRNELFTNPVGSFSYTTARTPASFFTATSE